MFRYFDGPSVVVASSDVFVLSQAMEGSRDFEYCASCVVEQGMPPVHGRIELVCGPEGMDTMTVLTGVKLACQYGKEEKTAGSMVHAGGAGGVDWCVVLVEVGLFVMQLDVNG